MRKFSYKSNEGKEMILSKEILMNILTAATQTGDFGIGGWGLVDGTKNRNDWQKAKDDLCQEQKTKISYADLLYKALENGAVVLIQESLRDTKWELTWENLEQGCSLYEESVGDSIEDIIANGNFNEADAQAIFQFALFGERIYLYNMRINKLGYKLLEVSPDGRLYPLFIGNKTEIVVGQEWKAKAIPTKGFAVRAGIHLGKIPSAPWLMNQHGEYASPRGKGWSRKWFKVLYNANNDYTEEALKQPGKCFRDVPKDGFYTFFEKGRCHWYICSDAVVVGELKEEERQTILKEMNFDEKAEFEPYRKSFEKRKATLAKKKEVNKNGTL